MLGGLVLFCATAASADGVGERVARGEDLAKQGKWTEAIENFKAADKLEPRAKHACLIALAYIRRELWPQAEVFLTVCQQRASKADPVPDWVPLAKQQLDERLGTAKVATVTIRVKPEALASQAAIAVSSFEPDETFGPRAIHLPRGTHLITATVPGREAAQQAIEITDDAARDVIFDFDVTQLPLAVAPRPATASSKAPWIVMAVGGAIMLGGAGYHVLEFKGTRDDLDAARTPEAYDALSSKFDSQRMATIALYGVGAAVIVTGVVYTLLQRKHQERAPRLGATPIHKGGMMVMEWSR